MDWLIADKSTKGRGSGFRGPIGIYFCGLYGKRRGEKRDGPKISESRHKRKIKLMTLDSENIMPVHASVE